MEKIAGNRGKGRPKGSLNKVTRDIKELAGRYTPEALTTLRNIMRKSESDAARVSAAKELLDRGHGRAHQSSHLTVDDQRLVARMPEPAADADEWLSGRTTH